MILAPLEDPTYTPVHQPVGGVIPPVIARWGVASQRRWFHRFQKALNQSQDWDLFYCFTGNHRGGCCWSCQSDAEEGYGVTLDFGWCCCLTERTGL